VIEKEKANCHPIRIQLRLITQIRRDSYRLWMLKTRSRVVFKPGTTDTSEHFAQQRVGKEVTGYVLKTEHERAAAPVKGFRAL
jgi:hypothetical protein